MRKQLANGCKIAFSMYSKIPVPFTEWTPENMRYSMCFFPLIGLVIGLVMQLWIYGKDLLPVNGGLHLFATIVLVLVPVLITGGIHVDGLLDTADALSSYMEQEKRLEILKDPGAGAFAVIYGIVYFLFYVGVYAVLEAGQGILYHKIWWIVSLGFVLSRAFSGLGIVTLKMAKHTGLAAAFADGAQKKTVRIVMCVVLAAASAGMIAIEPLTGALCVAAACVCFAVYRRIAYRKFGGITGDLAGCFLQCAELAVASAAMVGYLILIGRIV